MSVYVRDSTPGADGPTPADGLALGPGAVLEITWVKYGPQVAYEWFAKADSATDIVVIESIWDKTPTKCNVGVAHTVTRRLSLGSAYQRIAGPNPHRYALMISGGPACPCCGLPIVQCIGGGSKQSNVNTLSFDCAAGFSVSAGVVGEAKIGITSAPAKVTLLSGSGATTNSAVMQTDVTNSNGVNTWGTVKNTGANSMNVIMTVTDKYGTVSSNSTVVAPGQTFSYNSESNIGSTAFTPYSDVQMAVQSAVAGLSTTFQFFQSFF